MCDLMLAELDRLVVAVDDFGIAMKWKLAYKLIAGFTGWDDPGCKEVIQKRLKTATDRLLAGDVEQAPDVANLAMMLYHQVGLKRS